MLEHLNMKELQKLYENGEWKRFANIREELTNRFYFRIEFSEDEWIPLAIVINNKVELFLESDENSEPKGDAVGERSEALHKAEGCEERSNPAERSEHFPFSIILSDKKAGNVEVSNRQVYFYLSTYDFSKLLRDAKKIYSEYPDLDRNGIMGIPDTWFADTFLVKFVTEVFGSLTTTKRLWIIPNRKIQQLLKMPMM